jgi:hypothetical protein
VPGIHCYVAGSIPAVTPRYCAKKIEKCSFEHKKNKEKKNFRLSLPTTDRKTVRPQPGIFRPRTRWGGVVDAILTEKIAVGLSGTSDVKSVSRLAKNIKTRHPSILNHFLMIYNMVA